MHNWGDEGVDWSGISDAAYYIGGFLRRYGRVQVTDMKEKYGSCRVYCHFGWMCLLNITHPGWLFYRPYPRWLMKFDIWCLSGRRAFFYINHVIVPYQKWLYRLAYKKALKKWPHLEMEILDGADWQDLLCGLSERFDNQRSENDYP